MAVGGVLVRQLGTNAGVTQADPSIADKVLTDNGVGALPSFKTNFKFTTIAVSGQSDVVADSAADTLTLAAGTNITITTNAGTDTITITAAGGTDYVVASNGATPPAPADDGAANFIYVAYTP